jgi:hypothetical protein
MWGFKQFKFIEVKNPGFIFLRREQKTLMYSMHYCPQTCVGVLDAERESIILSMSRYPFTGMFFMGCVHESGKNFHIYL